MYVCKLIKLNGHIITEETTNCKNPIYKPDLFGIISVFGCMVYNSGDEVTMLNILAGSNELPPSANLPFKHNMHYFINWLLKFLFAKTAAVNWFSVILFSFQFSASVCISYLIYVYSKTWFSAVYILLLFVIFMVYMLMNLTTSTTSLVMGVAGIAMQWHFYKKLKLTYRHFIGPLLIIIASLIRIHTLFLIIVVAIPFFFLLPPRNRLMAIGGIVMTFLVVYFFSFLQQVYYEKNYPGWNTEENYRQAKYNYINYQRDTTSPLLDQWRLEVDMAERFLFFDTQLLSKSKIENLSTVARSSVPFAVLLKYSTWKWTFMLTIGCSF